MSFHKTFFLLLASFFEVSFFELSRNSDNSSSIRNPPRFGFRNESLEFKWRLRLKPKRENIVRLVIVRLITVRLTTVRLVIVRLKWTDYHKLSSLTNFFQFIFLIFRNLWDFCLLLMNIHRCKRVWKWRCHRLLIWIE